MSVQHVCVIGGGIAGLAAAAFLRERNPALKVTVLEKEPQPGGKIRTRAERGRVREDGAYWLDVASMLPLSKWLRRELALGDQLIPARPGARRVYVGGELFRVPDCPPFPLPLDAKGIAESPLFGPNARRQIADEPNVAPTSSSETMRDFFERRLGRDYCQLVAEPIFRSLFMTSLDRIGLEEGMPKLKVVEERFGSLTNARDKFLKYARIVPSPVLAQFSIAKGLKSWMSRDPLVALGSSFFSLRYGLGEIVGSLRERIHTGLLLNEAAEQVIRTDHGLLVATSQRRIHCNCVVCAIPAPQAAQLFTREAPKLATVLRRIDYTRCAVLTFDFPEDSFIDVDAGDIFVPDPERFAVRHINMISRKFPEWNEGRFCMRVTVDGNVAKQANGHLKQRVLQELLTIFGRDLGPQAVTIARFPFAGPVYAPGHQSRVREIRSRATRFGRLAFCGESCTAGGIPAIIQDAKEQVVRLIRRGV